MEFLEDKEEPLIHGMVKAQAIDHIYEMPLYVEQQIRSHPYKFGYGGFSESVYYRTYSQLKVDGTKETFPDTIIRVVTGIISIIKDWKIKHALEWDQQRWDTMAAEFGLAFMKMQLLPPGRGLWISGTNYSYKRGSAAFNNCGFVSTREGLIKSACWTMDSLMCGCGIGFDTDINQGELSLIAIPNNRERTYKIHDSREGWVKSLYLLLESYYTGVKTHFDYSDIRREGVPIKRFGGESSGPEPLRILHERVRIFLECYIRVKDGSDAYTEILNMTRKQLEFSTSQIEKSSLEWAISELEKMEPELRAKKTYGKSRLICDIFNSIGCCVVAGNVRRSSEIALASVDDVEFRHLKDHQLNPERANISWMSNNTVRLNKIEDFELLPDVAQRIKDNGEPGILNRLNVKRYGRVNRREPIGREAEEDKAIGVNPCCEINLESFEYCNLAEIFPSRCETFDEMKKAAYLATIYCSIVSLLPTHWVESNKVIARNRRIGVSMSGIVEEIARSSATSFTKKCRALYQIVRKTNREFAEENGVPESIRVTTVKPSGTISQLAGVSSGIHHPTYKYCIRRVRMSSNTKLVELLKEAGYPHEIDKKCGESTIIFSFPLHQSNARTAEEVSVWEQASNLAMLQREWADNCVSCTLYFNPKTEGPDLEHVLAHFSPVIKSLSALPHTEDGIYEQAPYEKITEAEYHELSANIKRINFSSLTFNDQAIEVRGCDSDKCELR